MYINVMRGRFKWIEWNIEHIARKGITPEEAESIFLDHSPDYPRRFKDGYVLWGRSSFDRLLQVAFAKEEDGRIFVFHARPLTDKEKRRYRD